MQLCKGGRRRSERGRVSLHCTFVGRGAKNSQSFLLNFIIDSLYDSTENLFLFQKLPIIINIRFVLHFLFKRSCEILHAIFQGDLFWNCNRCYFIHVFAFQGECVIEGMFVLSFGFENAFFEEYYNRYFKCIVACKSHFVAIPIYVVIDIHLVMSCRFVEEESYLMDKYR